MFELFPKLIVNVVKQHFIDGNIFVVKPNVTRAQFFKSRTAYISQYGPDYNCTCF